MPLSVSTSFVIIFAVDTEDSSFNSSSKPKKFLTFAKKVFSFILLLSELVGNSTSGRTTFISFF